MIVNSFSNPIKASFVSRPNRFIVMAKLENGKVVSCHCPNPGRLIELTLPGQSLLLEKSDNPNRKHAYTLVAAVYKNKVLPLYSVKANDITEKLILPEIFTGEYEVKREVSREFQLPGSTAKTKSRFDLLVTQNGIEHYIEVKACTLSEYGVSAFPDAPSERASRHVNELSQIPNSHIIIILYHQDAEYFTPNLHTDPFFAESFFNALGKEVSIHCASVTTNKNGESRLVTANIPILKNGETFLHEDQGSYLIEIKVPENGLTFECGALGNIQLEEGLYVYVGSAQKNLSKRIHRHMLKRKNKRWHIDYLTSQNVSKKAHPIYGMRLECEIAKDLAQVADKTIAAFGSSDCSCQGHLFYFKENAFKNRNFLDLLFKFRYQYLRPEASE